MDGDRTQVLVLIQIVSSDPGPLLPPFAVEAVIVVEGTGDDLRVVALELLRAQTLDPTAAKGP
jgi:hypothetical protein